MQVLYLDLSRYSKARNGEFGLRKIINGRMKEYMDSGHNNKALFTKYLPTHLTMISVIN